MSKPDKKQLIEEILVNKVYMPDSGLIVNLRKELAKMSVSNLNGLLLVIGNKTTNITAITTKIIDDDDYQTTRCCRCGNNMGLVDTTMDDYDICLKCFGK